MDPFSPFVSYLLDHGQVLAAVLLAFAIFVGMVLFFVLRARSAKRAKGSISISENSGPTQTTVVSGVQADGDVTVSPRQRNG
jgi:hypothetical protein